MTTDPAALLDELAEVLAFQKIGEPSVSIRTVKA